MPYTQFSDLDFGQIKTQIRNYLQSNSNFTDFDFEGSNFSVLIDTLAYNTYINSFNANLAVNETFLDSATIRENVVSLARNIGYVPRSKTSSKATISFQVAIDDPTESVTHLSLNRGLVCIGTAADTSYRFSITSPITSKVYTNGRGHRVSDFTDLEVTQGTFLTSTFLAQIPSDQKFILDNSSIDTSTVKVTVTGNAVGSMGREFSRVDNILNLNKDSEIYLIQEIQDEKVEILFGDGFFGKPLENNDLVSVSYIVSNGPGSNGAEVFDFQGSFTRPDGASIRPSKAVNITTVVRASNGSFSEDISSIKYLAPRLYSAQYRAVTPRDYEAIIKTIYPATESISVVGGEELSPPRFGTVQISIKPKNGTYVSDFDKQQIKNKLKSYAIAGINSEIIDLKMLYVEIESTVYYNTSIVSDSNTLKQFIVNSLETYSDTVDINKFGGRFKYSKINQLIDRVDDGITSNITKVKIRRDLKALINQFAQYELCFGNRFHINPEGYNIKSTGFYISGWSKVVYLTDIPNTNDSGKLDGSEKGVICIVSKDNDDQMKIVAKDIGIVDYKKGEIILNTINITSTIAANNLIEIQAFPDSNDVIGLKDLYLKFDPSNSTINMVKDVIASGEDVSGVVFSRDYYTSSYSNGTLERK